MSMSRNTPVEPFQAQPAATEPTAALVPACVAGDREARERLARFCLPRVRRTVMLSYGHGADTDDLVQIAIARVFAKLDTFRGSASFYVWVDRITINIVRDHFRRRRFVFSYDEESDVTAERAGSHDDEPDREFERYRLMEKLAAHFAAIKPKRRMPLVLAVAHSYTVPEIAAMLDISCDAAKKRLQRGRKELIGRLKRDPYCREVLSEMGR
jgi:RNA polymerase sigma-70 factor (ECF subfamily)